jgi:uncharacterized protein involved in copper resistance
MLSPEDKIKLLQAFMSSAGHNDISEKFKPKMAIGMEKEASIKTLPKGMEALDHDHEETNETQQDERNEPQSHQTMEEMNHEESPLETAEKTNQLRDDMPNELHGDLARILRRKMKR